MSDAFFLRIGCIEDPAELSAGLLTMLHTPMLGFQGRGGVLAMFLNNATCRSPQSSEADLAAYNTGFRPERPKGINYIDSGKSIVGLTRT
jgi:hypothetical protein